MQGIVSALKNSESFDSINIIDLIDEESVKLIKVKASVSDGTLLYITELHTANYQRYAYHWQKKNGELIVRWDNKPHWKEIRTFPHHKHIKGKVFPSHKVTIEDVIETVKQKVSLNE